MLRKDRRKLIGDAILAQDCASLCKILCKDDDERYPPPRRLRLFRCGRRAATCDDDIHSALEAAAREGSVEACRFLWKRLSRAGKQRYFAATCCSFPSPIYAAICEGQLAVVCLFFEEFKWNINQTIRFGDTPLATTVFKNNLEMSRFLLQHGANPNLGERHHNALRIAVYSNSVELARLLLVEYHANPNLHGPSSSTTDQVLYPRNTDAAIRIGYAEILRMLLDHGALLQIDKFNGRTSRKTTLNELLGDSHKTRETKLAICQVLNEHAKKGDRATARFMRVTLDAVLKRRDGYCCQTLLDSGIDPRMSLYCAIRAENLILCLQLVHDYRVDPFLQNNNNTAEDAENVADDDDVDASSPFVAAARLPDTAIFNYFMNLWNKKHFSCNTIGGGGGGGKNSDGDYPLHIVCCDSHVSLAAIEMLINRNADVLSTIDCKQGLYPFQLAAMSDASLDVIFYLLQSCSDALLLRHGVGNAAAAAPNSNVSS
jgi:Ankyrin repeats (3 copies)